MAKDSVPGLGTTPPYSVPVPRSSANDLHATVAAAQEGSEAAFDDLVRATYDTTYSHALRLVGNAHDAHDVAQDTYLKALRHLRGFRGDANVATWLYRITANSAHNLLARRQRHAADALPDDTPVADDHPARDPLARAETGDLRDRLVAALGELPTKLRVVVVLRDIYDLSHEAIAAQLGITESAAKVRLHRARQKLRAQLFGDDADDTDATDAADSLAEPTAVAAMARARDDVRRSARVASKTAATTSAAATKTAAAAKSAAAATRSAVTALAGQVRSSHPSSPSDPERTPLEPESGESAVA